MSGEGCTGRVGWPVGSGGSPTPINLAAALGGLGDFGLGNGLAGGLFLGNSCGSGCDGAAGTEENPNGQDGGLFLGSGGDGWNSTDPATKPGGNGGSLGLLNLFGLGSNFVQYRRGRRRR